MKTMIDRRVFCAALAAGVVLPAGQAAADTRTVEGTVFYRERMALPADAVVTVRLGILSGTALADTIIAQQTISEPGQVPIPFVLRFDGAKAPQDVALALDASITVQGALLFRSREAVPLPHASDAPLDILLVRASTTEAPGITGIDWQATAIDTLDDLAGAIPTLTLGADGMAGGNTGCNSYGGPYTVDGDGLAFGQMVMTFKMCADSAMRVERAFLDALSAVASFRSEGDELVLLDAAGGERVRLKRPA